MRVLGKLRRRRPLLASDFEQELFQGLTTDVKAGRIDRGEILGVQTWLDLYGIEQGTSLKVSPLLRSRIMIVVPLCLECLHLNRASIKARPLRCGPGITAR